MNKKLMIGVITVGLLLGGTTITAATMSQQDEKAVKIENEKQSNVAIEKDNLISRQEANP